MPLPTPVGPKILTVDIETAPLESYTWGIWEQNVALNQIKEDWTLLSFSAKWLGDPKVIYHDTGGRGASKVRDDRDLLKKLWAVLDDADIVVTQNGVSFDIRRVNARLVLNGFKPYSPIKVLDTKIIAQKAFAFTSNKLEWMSEKLTKTKKLQHKRYPGFSLWEACLQDNPKAWAEMKRYNIADTVSTEELYLKLRPWIGGHPNVAAYVDMDNVACPKCGSEKLQHRGTAVSQTGKFHRFQCQDCGGWSRGRKATNTAKKRASLLAN